MTVQDWGAIGELVGALAVVVTLIYLTLQMRQNTRAIRAQSVQDVTMSVRDYLLVMGQSSEFAAVLAKAQDEGLSALESKEEVQLRGFLSALIYSFQNAYDQWQLGTIGEEQWHSYRDLFIQILQFKHHREFWDTWKDYYSQSFVQEIEKML